MKNKIISVLICLIMVIGCSFNAFAYDNSEYNLNYYGYDNDIITSYEDISYENVESLIKQVQPNFKFDDVFMFHRIIYGYSGYDMVCFTYFLEKDTVVVYEEGNNGTYDYVEYSYYKYNSSTDAMERTSCICECITFPSKISFYQGDETSELIYLNGSTKSWILDKECPMTDSVTNAYLYSTTKDYSYLINGASYINIPSPLNVSLYKASNEKSLYLYYENIESEYEYDTIIEYDLEYYNASDECISLESVDDWFSFHSRFQYKIDITLFDEYDSSYLWGNIYNRYLYSTNDVGEKIYKYSPKVRFVYTPSNNSYKITYLDDDNIVVSEYEKQITDYFDYTSSYTGATINSSTLYENFGSDYSFLGGLFNGFGLLGSSGLIAFIGSVFSFIPTPIMTLIGAGVSAMVVIALFKLLVK